ncbi:uncharacterized protein I206_106625 [Kwoniella pini CBS 10737]|uniref:Stress-response A/B barrel domain-containing protein n=1 Tax=Kwoniella pini CBS 10737 TaxID=1296096 RepID=A0A1B9HTN2_9TREE|nr:uncharacterized protein I206_07484 [Kwoniella pini CBS 10737]OCF46631.1 hypothetical protein I206_07484 [Kwoniella pini CBS 10737]
MVVYHIVAFKTKSAAGLEPLRQGFLALPEKCLHPKTGKPYIQIARGGKQISSEGKDRGMQVCFVMEFENEDDLAYYIDEDPVHEDFKKQAGGEWDVLDVVAMDFNQGVF